MIPIDFFGCKREQLVTCTWQEAFDQFSCTGITIPDIRALAAMSEVLTGTPVFSAELVPLSKEPFREISGSLLAAVREATAEDLMNAGARWAELPPWKALDTNPMDLAGFLLHLQSLIRGPGKEENSIFFFSEASGFTLP